MRFIRFAWSVVSVAAIMVSLLGCVAVSAWAQTTSMGTITGLITDQSNAVVPDATVAVRDAATREVRTVTTNSAGRYVFVNLPPGTYDITVSKTGFEKVSIANNVIAVGMVTTQNVSLKVGTDTETVEVQSSGVELQTLNATVGNQVSGLALESLPTIARDTSTFLTLQSGISPDGSVAGTAVDQSSFQLDGGENTNDMDGSMSVYTPTYAGDPTGGAANQSNGVAAGATGVMPTPADSVEEFKVNVAGMGADFNSSAGAQVQIVTKRGTDAWHGTAYEYYLDNNLNANTWQNNFNGIPNPSFVPRHAVLERRSECEENVQGHGAFQCGVPGGVHECLQSQPVWGSCWRFPRYQQPCGFRVATGVCNERHVNVSAADAVRSAA